MSAGLPLSALLSQAFVAFTIEFDNEFERQMPHRTTRGEASSEGLRPWLVSMVMWLKFMRHLPEQGIAAGDLAGLAGLSRKSAIAWLTRMSKWWGYVTVDSNRIVRPTEAGRRARDVWRPLGAEIERRWQDRFGKEEIENLKGRLTVVARQLPAPLPDYLPILQYGLFTRIPKKWNSPRIEAPSLAALLATVLLAFALEFESESEISLAIAENVLRLAAEPVRVRDLPRLAGVSKEAIAMCLSFLERRGYATLANQAGSRAKVLTLTPKGRRARSAYLARIAEVETNWRERFGEDAIGRLRRSLEELITEPLVESALYSGIAPYRSGWRAALPRPEALPHYPMVLHRGGYPDGS